MKPEKSIKIPVVTRKQSQLQNMAITAETLEAILRRVQLPAQKKHFTHCPVRFNGTRSGEAVEDFLTSADFFKESEGITDENAVSGLSLLLEGSANTWWTGVKTLATTWEKAKDMIREEFAPRPPAYKIYMEVFSTHQNTGVTTGEFVAQKRALLANLVPSPSEETQLDMIYGLLRYGIRDRVPRSSVTSFAELLRKAREVEISFEERNSQRKLQTADPKEERVAKKPRVRCEYCRNFGHEASECRKKAAKDGNKENKDPARINNTGPTELKCYGCQRPGTIRRQCPATRYDTTPMPRL